MEAYLPDNTGLGGPVVFETYTVEAIKANEFAAKAAKEFLKQVEFIDLGDFFPVVFNNKLHYTFTISGSNTY